jgi:hypothetical protein
MKAKDFRLYSATTKRRKLAIYVSIARVRTVLAARLTTAALKGQLHHFEITTVDGTQQFWGIPDNH